MVEEVGKVKKNMVISVVFSAVLLTGLASCLICDISIFCGLTGSLIPASSIVFAWLVCLPYMILGKRGAAACLLSLSVFVIPYLLVLSRLTGVKEVFYVGAVMAVVSITFLWIITAVFSYIGRTDKLAALGTAFLTAIPFVFCVNALLYKMIAEPIFDIWDMLTVLLLLVLACLCFIYDCARNRNR